MYIVIVNPQAGFGKAEKLFAKIQKEPLFSQKNCRSFFTTEKGHAEKLAEQIARIHRDHLHAILVIGGDGTWNEVINGLHDYPEVPVAFIPAGSGNDFSRGLKMKLKGSALFRKIVTKPNVAHIFPGVYVQNGRYRSRPRYFMNSIGFGLDGAVIQLANQKGFRSLLKRFYLQALIYPAALVTTLKGFKPLSVEIVTDGKTEFLEDVVMLTMTNHEYYGGGMKITPKANIRSESFQLLQISSLSKKKLLGLFLIVFIGKHTVLKEVTERKVTSLKITSSQSLFYQADGESGKCFDCDIKKSDTPRTVYWG